MTIFDIRQLPIVTTISNPGLDTKIPTEKAVRTAFAPAFVSGLANYIFATPNGAPGVPSLRAIVAADIPSLNYQAPGNYITALTSDVTASGAGSVTATISSGSVTLAKMADMATASLIYRKTAGTGVPEVNTLSTLKTDLGLTGTNSGDQVIPANEGGVAHNFLTAYNSATGAWTKAQPVWGDIGSIPATFAPTAHNILSTSHEDTLADTVVRGDVLIGNSTPKWSRLVFPASPTGKVLIASATDVTWSTSPLGTAAYTASSAYDVAGAAAAITPTTLGLVIGTNVQAYNSNLTGINQALTSSSSPSFTTVTASLTGHASLDLPLTGGTLTGGLTVKPATNTLTGFVVNDKDANNVLTVDTINNRVGIGITSPTYTLDIVSPAISGQENVFKLKVSDANDYLSLSNNNSGDAKFDPAFLGYTDRSAGYGLSFIGGVLAAQDSGTTPLVNFQARRGGMNNGAAVVTRPLFDFANFSTSVMRILAGGNVGIGITAPTAKLHIVGSTDTQQLIVKGNATQTTNLVEFQTSAAAVKFSVDVSGNIVAAGDVKGATYHVGATAGVDGTFTTVDLKTVTVTKGIITSIV